MFYEFSDFLCDTVDIQVEILVNLSSNVGGHANILSSIRHLRNTKDI